MFSSSMTTSSMATGFVFRYPPNRNVWPNACILNNSVLSKSASVLANGAHCAFLFNCVRIVRKAVFRVLVKAASASASAMPSTWKSPEVERSAATIFASRRSFFTATSLLRDTWSRTFQDSMVRFFDLPVPMYTERAELINNASMEYSSRSNFSSANSKSMNFLSAKSRSSCILDLASLYTLWCSLFVSFTGPPST